MVQVKKERVESAKNAQNNQNLPASINIQKLINEYKQKLTKDIRKEEKDLIMSNINAY